MILFLAYRSFTLGSTWWRFLKSPEMDQKSSRASAASGNESRKCSGSGDPSDSPTKSGWFSPPIEWSRTKVDVVSTWSPPKRFYCSICDGEYEHFTTIRHFRLFRVESFSMGFWCVHLFQLLKVHNRYVSFPDSSRVQYITEEYSKEYLLTKLMDSWLVFRGYKMIFNNQWTNLNDRSFKWFFKSPFERCFRIRQAILHVSWTAVAPHGIRPPIFIRTCLQKYSRCPFFNSAYCSLSNPIRSWIVRVDVQWFHERSSQALPNSKELWVLMPFGFLVGSKNFSKLLSDSCEVFFFARVRSNPLSSQVLHHNCISVIVSRFRSFTKDFVICCYQVTKIFCTMYDFTSTSSARGPCNFSPLLQL